MLMNHTNQTELDLFSCYSSSVIGYRYFAVLWGCSVTIAGTLGNLLTILAFTLDPNLRTRFNALIVNLAAADLLYCTALQPFLVDTYLYLRLRSGQLWCSILGLLLLLSNSVSVITLCLLAFSRYLLVSKRAVFDRIFSKHGLILLLISAWAFGLATVGPLWRFIIFVPKVCTCSFNRIKGRPYTTILLFFYFFIGLGCVGTFYILIYRRVRMASQALLRYRMSQQSAGENRASSSQGPEDSGVESGNGQSEQAQDQGEITSEKSPQPTQDSTLASNPSLPVTVSAPASLAPGPVIPTTSFKSAPSRDDKEMKHVTYMCLTVFLLFVLCFVPFLLLNIADRKMDAPELLYMACTNLTWLNSCINPILYAVMNRQFRQAYHMLLSRAAAPFTCLWTMRRAQES